MKFLKSVLYIILSCAIAYLTWLIFHFLTPFLMNLGWLWLIVIIVVLGGVLVPLIGMLPGLLSALIIKLRSYNIVESILVGITVLFFAFCSVRLAWVSDIDYEGKHIFVAIVQNLLVLGVFWGVFSSLVTTKVDENK